jgi:hypothetical protein
MLTTDNQPASFRSTSYTCDRSWASDRRSACEAQVLLALCVSAETEAFPAPLALGPLEASPLISGSKLSDSSPNKSDPVRPWETLRFLFKLINQLSPRYTVGHTSTPTIIIIIIIITILLAYLSPTPSF